MRAELLSAEFSADPGELLTIGAIVLMIIAGKKPTPGFLAGVGSAGVIVTSVFHQLGKKGTLPEVTQPVVDPIDGFTPLHRACVDGNVQRVQALLPFHPNLHAVTKSGHTPLELVRGQMAEIRDTYDDLNYLPLYAAKQLFRFSVIEYMLQACDPTQNQGGDIVWNYVNDLHQIKVIRQVPITFTPPGMTLAKGPRLLCIDGGGTRGLVALELLVQLENRGRSILDSFDVIAGTSTGGIIALYLALGHSVAETRDMYLKLKDRIFSGWSRSSRQKVLEQELKAAFGEETVMGDIVNIRCIITSTSGTQENLKLVLFTNYNPETKNKRLWEVARSTSAAPTYFDPFRFNGSGPAYHDGGLKANNPTNAAMREVQKRWGEDVLKNGLVLSVGTGRAPDDAGTPLDLSSNYIMVRYDTGMTAVNEMTQTDGDVVKTARRLCKRENCAYFRLTPILPGCPDLKETDNGKLFNAVYHAKAYATLYQNHVELICSLLAPRAPGLLARVLTILIVILVEYVGQWIV